LLGARLERDASGYYRIARILRGQNWDRNYRSPLTEMGVHVKEGDFILTSGIGGGYPPDVVIGRVSNVEKTEQDLFQEVHVDHLASLTDLSDVLVLMSFLPRTLEQP
jgi:cell shape-determining protein MreC